jgi:lipopolysaccharide/colanic/teichoic acid biosynthesis glycosyltransferase
MENDRNMLRTAISIPIQSKIQHDWFSRTAKRLLDILASLLGLLVLFPFFALLGILIKRESAGPVFYRGPRMGKDGDVFGILKFRTMYESPASYAGPRVTAKDDERITPLGKWLRETKINELPQLWNVLVGEMSLVGPRPEDPAIAAAWPEAVRRELLSVRPGITSPATVAYHDEEKRLQAASVMEEYVQNILPDKLRLDQLYVRHHTFMTDLDAIFWTFVILIPRLRDQKISEGWLFGGPLTRIVRRYVSWTAIDFLAAFASISLAGALWRLSGPLDIGLWRSVELAVLLALLFGFCNTLLGLKMVAWSRAAAEDAARLVVSCGLVTLLVVAIQAALAPEHGIPLRFMYTAGLLVLASFIAVRYRLRLVTGVASRWITLRRSGFGGGERVLVVGAGAGSQFATWLLRRPDFRGLYTIAGIADDSPNKQGLRYDGVRVLGTTADIPELVRRHDIGVIFYAISKISAADSRRILATCKRTGRHLVMLSDVLRTLHTRLTKELPRCERICPYLVGVDSLGETDGVEGDGLSDR